MSERNFARMFMRETGQSPRRYYRLIRLSKARQRVQYCADTVSEIAASVGYPRAGPMARHYEQAFGVTPQGERRALSGLRGLAGC